MALISAAVWSQLEDSNGRQWVMPASSASSGLPRKLHGQERQSWRKDADLASRHIVFLPSSLSSTSQLDLLSQRWRQQSGAVCAYHICWPKHFCHSPLAFSVKATNSSLSPILAGCLSCVNLGSAQSVLIFSLSFSLSNIYNHLPHLLSA